MRPWASLLILLFTASLAAAQSLGEVAERERERREKEKQAGAKPKVIDRDGLATRTGKDSKGTFNPAAGSPRGTATPSPSSAASPTTGRKDDRTDVERRRAEARQRLEAGYATIAEVARDFLNAYEQYRARCSTRAKETTNSCLSLSRTIDELAVLVAAGISVAEEVARQGWLSPGELRDLRARYNMDDAFWDRLVRAVEQSVR